MNPISNINLPGTGKAMLPTPKAGDTVTSASLGDTFGSMLNDVNGVIMEAGEGIDKLASGDMADIHQVMVAAEKASVGMELVIEIRNRLLESYREIMRTQL